LRVLLAILFLSIDIFNVFLDFGFLFIFMFVTFEFVNRLPDYVAAAECK